MGTKKFVIYSVYHKLFHKLLADFVEPVHAGKANAIVQLPYPGDDTGENISSSNPGFCELTVLYWVWKNKVFKPEDVWGLCHYRRYFIIPQTGLFRKKRSIIEKKPTAKTLNALVNDGLKEYMLAVLKSADVIVQFPAYVSKKKGKILTIEEHYKQDHIAEHWEIMKEIIRELYPEYTASLAVFCTSHKMSFANMMVTSASVWNNYLEWLFNILFELEKRIIIPDDVYQARVFGFISERIINLYLVHNKLRLAYMPIAFFDK